MKKIFAIIGTNGSLKRVEKGTVTSKKLMESVTKDKLENAETITLEAKFMDFSEKSTNNRYYNRESFLEEVYRIAKLAEEGKLFCSADHPEDTEEYIVKSGKIAGIIEKVWYDESEDACFVRIKLIPTINGGGYDLMVTIKHGGVLSVSLRALGVMDEETTEAFVDSIYTIDVVAMPGMESSTARVVDFETGRLLESKKIRFFESEAERLDVTIAKDLVKKAENIKKKGGKFTVEDVEDIIKKGFPSANPKKVLYNTDNVISEMVNLGFDFDIDLSEREKSRLRESVEGVGEIVEVKLPDGKTASLELTKKPRKNNGEKISTAELSTGEVFDIKYSEKEKSWIVDENGHDRLNENKKPMKMGKNKIKFDRIEEVFLLNGRTKAIRLVESLSSEEKQEFSDYAVEEDFTSVDVLTEAKSAKTIAKGLEFTTEEDLFDYMEESFISGNRNHIKEMFLSMNKESKSAFLRYAKENDFETYDAGWVKNIKENVDVSFIEDMLDGEDDILLLNEKMNEIRSCDPDCSEEDAYISALQEMGDSGLLNLEKLSEAFQPDKKLQRLIDDVFSQDDKKGIVNRVYNKVIEEMLARGDAFDEKTMPEVASYLFNYWEKNQKRFSETVNKKDYRRLIEAMSDDTTNSVLENKKNQIVGEFPFLENMSDETIFAFDGLQDNEKSEIGLVSEKLTESEIVEVIDEMKEKRDIDFEDEEI